MAIGTRDKRGRAKSAYSDLRLYEAVADVARFANEDDPERLTQPAFDRYRADAGHPDAPTARAICMRLAENGNSSLPWKDVLERALDEETDRSRSHAAVRGAGERPYLGPNHLYFALNYVARELVDSSPTEDHYDAARERLIAADQLRGGSLLEELLPTSGQALRIAADELEVDRADWRQALDLADLEPPKQRPGRSKPHSVPMEEAIDLFVEHNREWPSHDRLLEFTRLLDCRLEQEGGIPWKDRIAAARARLTSRGVSVPAGVGPKALGAGRRKKLQAPAEAPEHWPRRGSPRHSEEACREAVRRYYDSLGAGKNPTKKGYMAFAAAHGLPSHKALDRWGGFKKLLEEWAF